MSQFITAAFTAFNGQAQEILTAPLAQMVVFSDQSAPAVFSSQFFIALIAGVVMAFAFQVLLTNFSIATGISAGVNPVETEAESWGKQIRRVEAKVGTGTIFIVNTALFVACFLAVKLALIPSPGLGAIVAVVIWSIYFLLLLWLSSRAVGSIVGAVGNTAGSGLQGVMATFATALSGQTAASQITNTVESSIEAVSKELQSTLAPDQLQENLQSYITKLPLSQSRLPEMLQQASNLSANLPGSSGLTDLLKSATSEDLSSGKLRQRLTELLGMPAESESEPTPQKQQAGLRDQTLQLGLNALITTLIGKNGSSNGNALSKLNLEKIAKPLSSLGQQFAQSTQRSERVTETVRADVEDYLLNSPSWYLRPNSLDHGFRALLYDPEADATIVKQQLEQLNRATFVDILNQREGMPPAQINDVADELELIRREVMDQVRSAAEQEQTQNLRYRVETYLSSAPKEALISDTQEDFTALLVAPDVTHETLGNRLLQFDRDTLMQILLAGRQDLNPEETEQILNALESARDRVLNQSQETWNQLQTEAGEFRQRVESYLRETDPAQFTSESIQQTLQTLLKTPEAGQLALQTSLGQLDRNHLEQALVQRTDLDPQQVNQILNQIDTVRDTLLHTPSQLTEQARQQYEKLIGQIGQYLRDTNREELNPEGIQRDLGKLLNDPQSGAAALRSRLAQVDRETLVKLLSQRDDLDETQVNQIINQVQDTVRQLVRSPRQFASRTRDQIRDFQTDLADYLRHTNREELNPEGIKRDLQLLLKHPRAGAEQLGDRVAQFDRDTLRSLLVQRQDINEEDVDRILNQVESTRNQLLEQAQRAQTQVKTTVNDWNEQLRDYFNSLEQPELNYEGIQRDVRKLFDDPSAGLDALRTRLSQFDRDTLVALLSSRSDISPEQANQIIDQIEAARDSVLQKAERLQTEAEQRIASLKQNAKAQMEEAQKTVATAAWWLFGTAITSVVAAAIAGSLASGGFWFLS